MSDSNDAYYALYLQEQQENKQLKAKIEELEKEVKDLELQLLKAYG